MMKRILALLFTTSFVYIQAQSVVIAENESSPDGSAILDVQSVSKGILLPRLTEIQRSLIVSPATGLLVYQTDNAEGFYFYNGISWLHLIEGVEEDPVYEAAAASSITDAGSGSVITEAERSKLSELNTQALIPTGTIIAFGGTTIPEGWLVCDGSSLSKTEFADLYAAIAGNWGEGTTDFNLPDLRGQFLRGVNGGSGNDPDVLSRTSLNVGGNVGDNVGSYQNDELASHDHEIRAGHTVELNLLTGGPKNKVAPSGSSLQSVSATTVAASGGNETRPKNAYVNFIIKY